MAKTNFLDRLIGLPLENRLITLILFISLMIWGLLAAPFDWDIPGIDRTPVPVDAIPDIGENQQIVFTEWAGRSPQDIEDQITYPLTVALLGTPEVKTVRSFSMFGFSTIYVIFNEDVDFYWSRSRILEKLNALPSGTLPDEVKPSLGPDATALGQVFWYTLEGRDEKGQPTGGWDLHELRSIQDYYVKYGLSTARGVAEVASVGGYVKEYQIDVNPQALRHYGISLLQVFEAVRNANNEIGARTVEVNRVEYMIRGLGFIEGLDDLEVTVLKVIDNAPITIADVAHVSFGPALRRGALDKQGSEVVGGVVVTRYGENPLATINAVKAKIKEISPGLPSKTLADGSVSQLEIIPFYDRSGLIYETLGTLNHALREEIIITLIVILVLLMHLRASILISMMMPAAVLITFVGMKLFHVDANIVALSGIAIAIGTIVDMGIIMTENILKKIENDQKSPHLINQILEGAREVGPAILTAVSTTVISFLPVFTMEGAEGKLFKPLAYTKTFALISSVVLAILVLPVVASFVFSKKSDKQWTRKLSLAILLALSIWVAVSFNIIIGVILGSIALLQLLKPLLKNYPWLYHEKTLNYLLVFDVIILLSLTWVPLGYEYGAGMNFLLVAVLVGFILGLIKTFTQGYPRILEWMLNNRGIALLIPSVLLMFGLNAWLGFDSIFGWSPDVIKESRPYQKMVHVFPGLGREFMPDLDEGSFLYMPTTMPHAGMEESLDVLSTLDRALNSIPEVENVVGKIGRAETPLDPAPLSMIESVVTYKSEYIQDGSGNTLKFEVDDDDQFVRDSNDQLIPDSRGKPFRQWRSHIRNNQDIWDELVRVAQLPGTTSAPKLQPIAARIVMLQSGMRAPMGIRVHGSDIESMEAFGLELETYLKEIPSVKASAVFADRIVGKPYLEIDIHRQAIARYGLSIRDVQQVIAVAIGGKQVGMTIEGRERYPIRVRYMREFRESDESFESILVPTSSGAQIPLGQLASVRFTRGPQVIKSENTFLLSYVLFDKVDGYAEVDVVEQARAYLDSKIDSGELNVPSGVSFDFTGSYENQVRATKRMRIVLPLALMSIFVILYMQFKRTSTTAIVFSGIFVAWAGGFTLIWLYGQPWFMDFSIGSLNFREIFQIHEINLSVAVWVGFLALFGIATDDGVLISTYLDQQFEELKPTTRQEIQAAAILAGKRRIRPAMLTTATTLLALIPVLTSTGRGADVMVPMAIPSFGGMLFAITNTFVVPVMYVILAERRLLKR
ncbi:MAG: efflux RND transporter permease subunit [Candidatus Marinimicrobia bacterium]|jgi:Cu(I)/Ag(I) efflux system membrane protein CusA/SilA|nr:efflux RND transporter permease subunit [Candidatus Neomarinimicrobiota bacterium]MBT3575304.1 efflux RND transporter permease subunit [Candidatus Neomarinimicrobiota bacterium]MBT3680403.1 efflux RND transporter permease subunit [Candidatus Neomarinimicrobiota bacterium]MBT3951832.1 efflux RND transporter permease subunit [Candidatus Neomarinimicrobiota bacterium]MBT4252734.1 efflux RND transporter permease subunit [Candidatus Neomarinimicrobiota bacterium]